MPTTSYTYSQLPGAITGYTRMTATEVCFGAGATAMYLSVTGTDCRLYCTGGGPNPYWVSVDDGAWANPAISGGKITLFSGLSDVAHRVHIAVDPGYSYLYNGMPLTGTLVEVDGAVPSAAGLGSYPLMPFRDANCAFYCAQIDTPDAGVTPTKQFRADQNDSMIVAVNSTAQYLWVLTRATAVMVSIDRAAPVKVALPTSPYLRWHQVLVGADMATHIFRVSTGCNQPPILAVAPLNGTASAVPQMKRVIQFGDSITQAQGVGIDGIGEAPYISAALDCLCCANGHGGATTAQITSYAVASIPVLPTTPDVLVLASGRNDSPGAQFRADYANAIESVLNLGCRRVVCRGVAPGYPGVDWGADINADVQAAVASTKDDRVAFVDTGIGPTGASSLWPDISTYDGVHPDAAGYATMGTYIARDYPGVWAQHYSVLIVAGQSNANGMGTDAATALASAALLSVSQYSVNAGTLTTGNLAPVTLNGTPRIGPDYSMARVLDAAGLAPYVIRHALGGVGFYQTNDLGNPVVNYNLSEGNATYSEWARLKTTVRNALRALTDLGDTYSIRAFVWVHGETDSKTATPGANPPPQPAAANAYAAHLQAMFDALAVEGWDGGTAPVPKRVIVSVCTIDAADTTFGEYGQVATVQGVQAYCVTMRPAGAPYGWIDVVDPRGFALTQGVHHTTGSTWALGEQVAAIVGQSAGIPAGYGGN